MIRSTGPQGHLSPACTLWSLHPPSETTSAGAATKRAALWPPPSIAWACREANEDAWYAPLRCGMLPWHTMCPYTIGLPPGSSPMPPARHAPALATDSEPASAGECGEQSGRRPPVQRPLISYMMARDAPEPLLCTSLASLIPTALTDHPLDPRAGVNMLHPRCPSSPTPLC